MRNAVFVMIGGALGAVLRMAFKNPDLWTNFEDFPLDTLLINLVGSFILAFFLTVTIDAFSVDVHIRTGIATGILGAFTTFSTLCKELFLLIMQDHLLIALAYFSLSLAVGLLLAYAGYKAGRAVVTRHQQRLVSHKQKMGELR